MARPSLYKPEYCDQLVAHMEEGLSFRAFAATVNVGRKTLYRWVKAHPEFKEAKEIAEEKAILFWERLALKMIRGQIRGGQAAVLIYTMKARFQLWDQPKPVKGDNRALAHTPVVLNQDQLLTLVKKVRGSA